MLKSALHAAFMSALLVLGTVSASAQTVMYPIPEAQKEPKTVQDYPVFVNRMIAEENYEKALQYADEGLKRNPKNVALAFKRGTIFELMGKKDEAAAVYSQLITLYPEIPEPYNNLAILIADSGRGDLGRATELLERAITANPRFHTAHENLADIYALRALQSYRKAVPRGSSPQAVAAAKRVQEKISLLQIVTGNDPAPEENSDAEHQVPGTAAAAGTASSVPSLPAAVSSSVQKSRQTKKGTSARTSGKTVRNGKTSEPKTSVSNGILRTTTTVNGITETVERPAAAARPQAAPASAGSVSASTYSAGQQNRKTESTLFNPLPSLE